MKIKASQITNLTDARYFAARDVEWMSFDFRENAINYIEPMRARAMFEWVEGPLIVGEFDQLLADEIRFFAEGWGLKAVQLGIFTPISVLKELKGIPIIKEISIETFTNVDVLAESLKTYAPYVEAFQLNFEKGDVTWADLNNPSSMLTVENLKYLCEDYNIIIDIFFETIDIEAIQRLNPYGLSLKGSAEERIGVKTFDEMDEILEALGQTL